MRHVAFRSRALQIDTGFHGGGSIQGRLFCQPNYGIVGLWLMPEPEAFCFFFIKLDRDENLPPLIDRLRELRMAGLLQSAIHIGNDLRILSGAGRYPWVEAGGVTPLPDEVRRRMRAASGIGAWNAGGSLTGTSGHVRASRAALRKAARGLGKIVFVDDRKLALGEFAAKCLAVAGLGGRMRKQLESLKPNYGLLKGIPTEEPLLGAQWRLRHPPEGVCDRICDPLDAGCGLMWVSPVLPSTGHDASTFLDVVTPIFKGHGFETLVTFTMITERAMIAITNVAFDKAEPEESARARACYDALMDAVICAGYYPYRVSMTGMPKLRDKSDTFWQVAEDIKRALDPKDIISRGRYVPPLDP
jgi:4-cresol dehydrogenase (hydroxylating)